MDHNNGMGETVVGASCDLCPMFCRSQSTWSSTLVYTPEQVAVKVGERLEEYLVTWLAASSPTVVLSKRHNSQQNLCIWHRGRWDKKKLKQKHKLVSYSLSLSLWQDWNRREIDLPPVEVGGSEPSPRITIAGVSHLGCQRTKIKDNHSAFISK